MSRMIQIRNVPDPLHRRLKARAAAAGMTLSDYLRTELERVAGHVTPAELAARIATLEPAAPRERASAAVRAERESRR